MESRRDGQVHKRDLNVTQDLKVREQRLLSLSVTWRAFFGRLCQVLAGNHKQMGRDTDVFYLYSVNTYKMSEFLGTWEENPMGKSLQKELRLCRGKI